MLNLRENNLKCLLSNFLTILIIFCNCVGHRCASSPAPTPSTSPAHILALIKHRCPYVHISMAKADLSAATVDFGNITHYDLPLAVLYPTSISDIACIVRTVFRLAGSAPQLTLAAKGAAHSLRGQAQALGDGLVMAMESQFMKPPPIRVVRDAEPPYVEVYGGELWIDVLNETLKHGLSPRSWTDYLYVTVGGTLSNAGVSGQTFRFGPQISNVYQLEVVTGKGKVLECSHNQNPDLFYGVLGGLGQFGIITRARIALRQAPQLAKWITASYTNFTTFCEDQEHLISLTSPASFDYVEGFVTINTTNPLNFTGPIYLLEVVKYFSPEDRNTMEEIVESLLSALNYIPSTLNITEASYLQFLQRVHTSEIGLQAAGRWEVPHPWLNLQLPRSKVQEFADVVFGKIIQDSSTGPIISYPVYRSKWNNRTSAVLPDQDDEEVIYLVSVLFSVPPSPTAPDVLNNFLIQNERILKLCETANLGAKQYLAYYTTMEEWQAHFGPRWDLFQRRKITHDPLAILAPGQRIFPRQ